MGKQTIVALLRAAGITIAIWIAGLAVLLGVMATTEPEEDEPGWNCAVHGNRVCGPGAPGYGK